jgi:glucosamine--fructose-6-phosphate aminotransferase (isomerizing)
MCGIIGYTGSREAAPLLLEGLRRLEYRGYDSAGVAVLARDRRPATWTLRSPGKIAALAQALSDHPVAGTCGIGHTRWATHGAPTHANAHPHRCGRVSVVHNGIIENHRALRLELVDQGRTFTSDTDTEVLAHLLDLEYARDSDLHAALRRTIGRLEGAWAVCAVHDEHPAEIVAARHASPLLVGLAGPGTGEDSPAAENFVASDVAAVLAHTRMVIDLEDGDTVHVTPEAVEIRNAAGEPVRRRPRRVAWSAVAAEKQGFKHFMLKEIFEQPRAIRDTIMGRIAASGDDAELDGFAPGVEPSTRILLLGCGTSWHAALAGKYFIEQLARIPVEVDLASEFRYRAPIVRAADLVIAISQSGETADTLAAMHEARRLGGRTLAICNVVDSTIARAAQQVLYTHAGPEISVASTKAFTTQLTMLLLLAIRLGRATGALTAGRARELLEGLRRLPVAIDRVLEASAAIRDIARRHGGARDVLFLGRGLSFPVALEGALKLKEISYVHAEGYASGEMKHGPIALVDEHVPVVVIAPRGPGYEKSIANLEEIRSRGGRVIAIATAGDEGLAALAQDTITIPEVDAHLQPIVASVPLQLLAYHVADLKGTDVDQPRNLAKSVTVE